jgi:predicted TIM-barrel fold metal-dependent hydrolase
MRAEDLILVSIDDHIVEPRDMFYRHVPERWKDEAPRCVTGEDGTETWMFQGVSATSVGLNAVVSWPNEEWGLEPASFAEMRPGAYDVHERVRDMNHNGILASMCFPSFAGFNARFFHEAKDHDLALVMLKAYNDWHVDEWCAAYPGRFIPLGITPVWDSKAIAEEVRRLSKKGCKAVSMPELPHLMGLPSYHDMDYWGPFFEAVCDEQVVMCLHIGQGFSAIQGAPDGPIDNFIILATQISVIAAQDLLWGPAFRRYPDLKVAWSEAGIGWIPFYLNRCDRHYTNQRWLHHDFGGKLPSEVFREHSLACFVTDPTALKVRDDIGIDIIAWECDYPHSDSIFPGAPEFILDEMQQAGCSDAEMHKITWENTSRFFDIDPFRVIPREQATVGALRALSPDVDTTVRSRHEWRQRYESRHSAG